MAEGNPGRLAQAYGTARELEQSLDNVDGPVWASLGNEGDSQCYLGVDEKVFAVFDAMSRRIAADGTGERLIEPFSVGGVSDGQLNGTPEMRFSLIGRESANDQTCLHLTSTKAEGVIAVVACDKPPVGTLAAILEHNVPSVIMSDGSIRPGRDPVTGDPIDIVDCFQVAGSDDLDKQQRFAEHACPGYGSCGGMFTYNTMQSFIATIGMEPLHMVSPASEDSRRVTEFPDQLVDCLVECSDRDILPRDIVTPESIRNGIVVAMAMGGSTNIALHAPEIARAAGYDFWTEVMTMDEFNDLSRALPVLVNARPFGKYSMVDIDANGGLQVIVKELLDGGFLDGDTMTCTGETLQEQVERLDPSLPDGEVIYTLAEPFKETGGLRLLRGNLAPNGGAIIKLAGIQEGEGGIVNNQFTGSARVFDGEIALLDALTNTPDIFQDNDMVVIRYEGPRGAPGMPEMLDPTSRITAICNERKITIGLMTDARFSGGSVGLVIGHVSPEAFDGGPIALVEDGDTIVVDLERDTIDCVELSNREIQRVRHVKWLEAAHNSPDGLHPATTPINNRLLGRMRFGASTALKGAGMAELSSTPVVLRTQSQED